MPSTSIVEPAIPPEALEQESLPPEFLIHTTCTCSTASVWSPSPFRSNPVSLAAAADSKLMSAGVNTPSPSKSPSLMINLETSTATSALAEGVLKARVPLAPFEIRAQAKGHERKIVGTLVGARSPIAQEAVVSKMPFQGIGPSSIRGNPPI